MADVFLLEAIAEKLRQSPDNSYVQRMQQLSGRKMTIQTFKMTGRYVSVEKAERMSDSFQATYNTESVIMYIFKGYILKLDDGSYQYTSVFGETYISNDIDELESIMFSELEHLMLANN